MIGMPCRSWRCDRCAVSNRRAFGKRLRLGLAIPGSEVPKLLTLTSLPDEGPWDSRARLSRRFASLRRRLESAFPGVEIEYAGVVERTRRGAIHFHVVLRGAPFMPPSVWSRLAARSGFGYIVDVRRANVGVRGYLTKSLGTYLTKEAASASWPAHFRRIRFSREWAPEWVPRSVRTAREGDRWVLHRLAVRSTDEAHPSDNARGSRAPSASLVPP